MKKRTASLSVFIFLLLMIVFLLAWYSYWGPLQMAKAAINNDCSKIKLLYRLGVNPDKDGFLIGGPLHCAAGKGNIKATTLLLEYGADINRVDGYGDTPLHRAVLSAQNEMVKLLLEAGSKLNMPNKEGKTPLDLAIEYKNKLSSGLIVKVDGKEITIVENDDILRMLQAQKAGRGIPHE